METTAARKYATFGGLVPTMGMTELPILTPIPAAAPTAVAQKPKAPTGPSFSDLVKGLGKEIQRGEALVDRASHAHGKDLSTGDLLALQAGVYRYVEVVDLTSKLVDRATQAVKQVTQGSG